MKKSKSILLLCVILAVIVLFAGCGSSDSGKKQLPSQTDGSASSEGDSATHYKASMVPFDEVVPSDRIVILQSVLNYSREGFFTEETKPVTTEITYNGNATQAYALTYALDFLTNGTAGQSTIYEVDGTVTVVDEDELKGCYAIIEDFQSGDYAILYNPETGLTITQLDYIVTANNEGIYSVITEQDVNVYEMFTTFGWDTTKTYNVVATDQFYIPITPEDYDDGEIRGALSGSINASFLDMTIAQGKINDVIYVEKIAE